MNKRQKGFTLVETVIGLAVMALVITGGLIAIGQTTLISEKTTEQIQADYVLRGEVEALRELSWAEAADHHRAVQNYTAGPYPSFISFDETSLGTMGLVAETSSARISRAGETGKLAFKILVRWDDRSGRSHEEARVLVITEGGVSAKRSL